MAPSNFGDIFLLVLLLCLLCIVAIYDMWADVVGSRTVSSTVWEWSRMYPVIPLIVGLILGHLFWQRPR